jgi:hypothetical protein
MTLPREQRGSPAHLPISDVTGPILAERKAPERRFHFPRLPMHEAGPYVSWY